MDRNSLKNIFAIHGGGSIGLGLMADIVANSSKHYEIIATSNNLFRRDLINSSKKYWLQHGADDYAPVTCVKQVKMISRNTQDIIRLYQEANLLALCVTPNVFTMIAKDTARGLLARYKSEALPLKILILMNITKSDQFVYQHVLRNLLEITQDNLLTLKILSNLEFVPTVIDRIVTPISFEKIKNGLLKQLYQIPKQQLISHHLIDKEKNIESNIHSILTDRNKLRRAINIFNLKFNLFNAERNYSMYVPPSFKKEALDFPAIKVTNHISQVETLKNKFINGPHAILAWLGALFGCKTIAESISKPFIYKYIKNVMKYEIRPVLKVECPDFSDKEIEEFETNFFSRCQASVNDSVKRVGRDPLRKLQVDGNIRGTIELSKKHNLHTSTNGLEKGIAFGILYALAGVDPLNPECKKITHIYRKYHSYAAILCYRKNANKSYSTIRLHEDKAFINSIIYKIFYFRDAIKNKTLSKNI